MVAAAAPDDLRRVLDDEGKPLPGARVPAIPDATLQRIFDTMLLVRIVDDRMMRLQRQGRLGFYLTSIGEEATHFAVAALRDTDWVFPSYREPGAWFWRGYTIQQYIDQLFGNEGDPAKGRQMPVHHSAAWLRMVSISSPVGTQIPQAVGAAYAARVRGTDDLAMTFFGEGASSTGQFHVGLNFAGVWKAPCIFFCRNNGNAISVPRDRQTAARSFAAKAIGYGMPGVRVDGNDVLAVWQVTSEAIDRARGGRGPTLIEAVTDNALPPYRVQGHPSSDDPSVSRDAAEPAIRAKQDPLARLRGFLRGRGLWTEAAEQEFAARYDREITEAVAEADRKPAPPVDSLFDDVYEQLPWNLREQRAYLRSQARTKNPHHHG